MNDKTLPAQHQERQPGLEHAMHPEPVYLADDYRAAGKLAGKVAIITGGDSGIGRAVAVHYALEGARGALVYLCHRADAACERWRRGQQLMKKPEQLGELPAFTYVKKNAGGTSDGDQ